MGIATHPHVRPAAVENLVSIGRTVRIVVMVLLVLIVAATAATIAAATRPLPIVWSH
jgi:cell division protein FtsX